MHSALIIIPAYNESIMIGNVINSIPKKIKGIAKLDILVVDDGSIDRTYDIAKSKGIKVLKHVINRGLGGALATAFEFAKLQKYDFMVTFDADGQHDSRDINKILRPLVDREADVVIGSRMLFANSMPFLRKVINRISNIITYVLFNVWSTDSQSGLRGFSLFALRKIRIRTQRMEVSSEIFKEISRNRLQMKEVPTHSIYTNYSLTKGQRISNAPNVFWKLLLNRFT